jgi:hypothetical protein
MRKILINCTVYCITLNLNCEAQRVSKNEKLQKVAARLRKLKTNNLTVLPEHVPLSVTQNVPRIRKMTDD